MPKANVKDAVITTLKRIGTPLSIKDIYNRIIEWDYYRFNAIRPEGIVAAEIRRHCVGVDFPSAKPNKFYKILNDGTYWLLDEPVSITNSEKAATDYAANDPNIHESDLRIKHEIYASNFKTKVLVQIKSLSPRGFENFSMGLLSAYGFEDMQVTQFYKDGGIDGFGKLKIGVTNLDVAFQAKRWTTSSVSAKEVQAFRGSAQGKYPYGVYLTTSKFTKDAQNVSIQSGALPVILIDGETILDIMIEKKFCIDIEVMPVFINNLSKLTDQEV